MLKNLFKNSKVIAVLFIALLVGISLYCAFLRTKQLDYIKMEIFKITIYLVIIFYFNV